MASLPVICRDCGHAWAASNIIGGAPGAQAQISMFGNTVSPCPACGGTGAIVDGEYELVDDTLRLLRNATHDDLARAQAILGESGDADLETVTARIAAEAPTAAPAISALMERSKGPTRRWAKKVLPYLISAALAQGTAVAYDHATGGPAVQHRIERVIEHEDREITKLQRNIEQLAKTVGRNDKCPCGSGHKFKKCCGRHPSTGSPR